MIALRSLRSLSLIVIIALRSLRLSPKLPYLNYAKPVRQYSITGVRYRIPIVLILAPPFRFLVPRNHLSFMPPLRNYRSSKLSARRRELAYKLIEVAIRPYSLCVKGNKQYLIGVGSERYSNCVLNSRKYNLMVSAAEIRRIETARKDVRSEIRTTVARLTRL